MSIECSTAKDCALSKEREATAVMFCDPYVFTAVVNTLAISPGAAIPQLRGLAGLGGKESGVGKNTV